MDRHQSFKEKASIYQLFVKAPYFFDASEGVKVKTKNYGNADHYSKEKKDAN